MKRLLPIMLLLVGHAGAADQGSPSTQVPQSSNAFQTQMRKDLDEFSKDQGEHIADRIALIKNAGELYQNEVKKFFNFVKTSPGALQPYVWTEDQQATGTPFEGLSFVVSYDPSKIENVPVVQGPQREIVNDFAVSPRTTSWEYTNPSEQAITPRYSGALPDRLKESTNFISLDDIRYVLLGVLHFEVGRLAAWISLPREARQENIRTLLNVPQGGDGAVYALIDTLFNTISTRLDQAVAQETVTQNWTDRSAYGLLYPVSRGEKEQWIKEASADVMLSILKTGKSSAISAAAQSAANAEDFIVRITELPEAARFRDISDYANEEYLRVAIEGLKQGFDEYKQSLRSEN